MPVFQLNKSNIFPPSELADESGILAVGGDLKPERLLLAYANGIFPWYQNTEPIMWWSPDPRMVLFPDELKISNSMVKILRKRQFSITFDKDFKTVIESCRDQPRKNQQGTWITKEMTEAYLTLHEMGYAHSVEVWKENKIVGGLYGISLGKCFFGESMFSKASNSSKAGFISLVNVLRKKDFQIVDCQVYTKHLESLGAREISRTKFLQILKQSLKAETLRGNWNRKFQLD